MIACTESFMLSQCRAVLVVIVRCASRVIHVGVLLRAVHSQFDGGGCSEQGQSTLDTAAVYTQHYPVRLGLFRLCKVVRLIKLVSII